METSFYPCLALLIDREWSAASDGRTRRTECFEAYLHTKLVSHKTY